MKVLSFVAAALIVAVANGQAPAAPVGGTPATTEQSSAGAPITTDPSSANPGSAADMSADLTAVGPPTGTGGSFVDASLMVDPSMTAGSTPGATGSMMGPDVTEPSTTDGLEETGSATVGSTGSEAAEPDASASASGAASVAVGSVAAFTAVVVTYFL